jgi:hypothetical protein
VGYYNRQRRDWGSNRGLEVAIAAIVLCVVVLTLVVFLFVYHDVPLRTP